MRKRAPSWIGLVVLGLLWAAAASLLWRTEVPANLELPNLDERRFFGERALERSEHFERFLRADWLLATVAELAALAFFAWRGPRLARGLPVGRIGKGLILGLLALALVWAVNLPFGLAAQWWQRRHGLSEASYLEWIIAPWAELQALVISTCFLIALAIGLAGSRLGRRWWIGAAAVLAAIGAGLTFVAPYLVTGETRPLRGALERDARVLEQRESVGDVRIDVEDVRDYTNTANAFAVGFGPTERVVLWNTLIAEPFTRGEIRVVIAHELAHLGQKHILKGLAWFALISLLIAFAVDRATRRRGGMANPAAVPVAALVLALAQLVLAPVENLLSRRYEAEADWVALKATRDPASARTLFKRFSTTSLQQPDPPAWDYVMLQTHPTIMQRIAMAEAWRDRGAPRR